MKEDIFKAYDIRGKYPGEIGKEETRVIARAFLAFIKERKAEKKKIVVARDRSFSSKFIYPILKREFFLAGAEVVDLGEATTPMWNWFIGEKKTDGGIMVTASHLPDNFTGFKMAEEEARPVEPKKIIPFLGNFSGGFNLKGKIRKGDKKDYFNFLRKSLKIKRKIRVAVDAAGGEAAEVIHKVLEGNEKVEVEEICFKSCQHKDNPLEEKNSCELRETLVSGDFDFGVMFDGDGDRVVFFNEKGEFINPSVILAFLVNKELKRGEKMVGDLNLSMAVSEEVKIKGGKFIESKVGHIFMKEKMRQNKAVLGGENSGHIYFKEMFYAEGAVLAFLKVLSFLSCSDRKIGEAVAPFQKYFKAEEKSFSAADGVFEKILDSVKRKYKNGEILFEDGIKVKYPEWWFSVRRSNTEKMIRLNFEAREERLGKKKFKEVLGLIKNAF